MPASFPVVGARFQLRPSSGSSDGVALAQDLLTTESVLLARVAVTASAEQVALTLDQHGRFAIGVPGLVRPHASGVEGGLAFLAFRAPPGGVVAEPLPRTWPKAKVAELATQLAAALGPLHEQGIAHGCLRPELVAAGNGPSGGGSDPILFGFGIAAVATAFGAPGEASQLVPPEYRAPELRASLSAPTPASDVFSLAVLLRRLLAARADAAEPDTADGRAKAVVGRLSSELEACLVAAAAPNPRERPHDIRRFAAEFARLVRRELEPTWLGDRARVASAPATIPPPPTAETTLAPPPTSEAALAFAARGLPLLVPPLSVPAPPAAMPSVLAPFAPFGLASVGPTPSVSSVGPTPSVSSVGPMPSAPLVGPTPSASSVGPTPSASSVGPMPSAPSVGPMPSVSSVGPTPSVSLVGPPPSVSSVEPTPSVSSGGPRPSAPSVGPMPSAPLAPSAFVPTPFVPTPFVKARRGALAVWLLVASGALLMLGAVAGVWVYAARRDAGLKAARVVAAPGSESGPSAASPSVSAPPERTAPGSDPSNLGSDDSGETNPGETSPGETNSGEPNAHVPRSADAMAPSPERVPPQKIKPGQGLFSSRHAPLKAPGVGPASFPSEATAAMPVLGGEPIWGTRAGQLTWVVFADLDCPYSRRALRALAAMKQRYGDDLRIVFRHRPLREHPNALRAAQVFAGLERRRGSAAFFAALARATDLDQELTEERLANVLRAAGHGDLSLQELERGGKGVVDADLQLAGQFGVRATPTAFLNGQRIEGERTEHELDALLSNERRAVLWDAAAGAPESALYSRRVSQNLLGVGSASDTRSCVPLGDSPVRGPDDALVTLVEFSDFECPFCKSVEPTVRGLIERHPTALRLVWKNFPLTQHKAARLLANFAVDARLRGSLAGFWAVHDALFAKREELDDSALGALAGKAGLDGELLLSSARAGAHDAAIRADVALGERLGVRGTPTFFVNGRRVQGALSPEAFEILIREETASAERIVSRGVARADVYGLLCE